MKRIFPTLAVLANLWLLVAVVRGLNIGDAQQRTVEVQNQIGSHMLIGLGALTFATLVHAILLTWFMGTGRWIEETTHAYSLDQEWHRRNQKTKYGLLPGMTLVLLLLVATAALGAVADPATPASLDGTLGMTGASIHFAVAVCTLLANLLVNFLEFVAVHRNSTIVERVLTEVHRIRRERGLPVGD